MPVSIKTITLLAACALSLGACAQVRLIGMTYAVPPAMEPRATPASSAADLSTLDVDFRTSGTSLGGLKELDPQLRTRLEVRDGRLAIKGVSERAGWYSDRSGPMLYRLVTGNFLVETRARSVLSADNARRPTASFNTSGLLVRDPSSTRGNMRWLMYNFGQQDAFYGTEAKNTVPDFGGFNLQSAAGFNSRSTLFLTKMPDGFVEADLRICRIGGEFRFFKRLAGSGRWVEERQDESTTIQGNGASRPTPGVVPGGVIRFQRDDMPGTVQVGLISNPGFPPNDGESQFAYLRFKRITDFDACVR